MKRNVYKLGNRTVELDGHARSNDLDESQLRGLIWSFQKKAASILLIPEEAMDNMKEQAQHEAGIQALQLVKLIGSIGSDAQSIVEAGRKLASQNAIDTILELASDAEAARTDAEELELQRNSYGLNSIMDKQLANAGITASQRTGRTPLRTNSDEEVRFVPLDHTGNAHILARKDRRSRITDEDMDGLVEQNIEKFYKDRRLSLGILD